MTSESGGAMSEREEVCQYCGTAETPHYAMACIAALRSQLAAVRDEREAAIREMAKARTKADQYQTDTELLSFFLLYDKEHGSHGLLAKVFAAKKTAERERDEARAHLDAVREELAQLEAAR